MQQEVQQSEKTASHEWDNSFCAIHVKYKAQKQTAPLYISQKNGPITYTNRRKSLS